MRLGRGRKGLEQIRKEKVQGADSFLLQGRAVL
jgi:hypothetical protein